ncbi:MAG: hypothetical protein V1926_06465 [Candidatus Peregrinibacteria bacterium]
MGTMETAGRGMNEIVKTSESFLERALFLDILKTGFDIRQRVFDVLIGKPAEMAGRVLKYGALTAAVAARNAAIKGAKGAVTAVHVPIGI